MWKPQPEDLQRVFDEQNPWHVNETVPTSLAKKVERPLAQLLWRRLMNDEPRRFQLVLGPRRVGKTTVLYQTVRHLISEGVEPARIWWLRMDHPLLLQEDLGDLVRAVLGACDASPDRPAYVMLDEIVYAADWDLWLKAFYDEQWPIRIAATSSATAALRDRRLESGVGRWAEQHLTPYLFPEFLDLANSSARVSTAETLGETLRSLPSGHRAERRLEPLRRRFMLVGGFPELLTARRQYDGSDETNQLLESQQVLRNDAVERAVYKDIPQSFGVDNPLMLERLLYVLAGQITGILSPGNICRELGLSQPTFDRYLSYLERAFLVFTLTNYSGREASVQKRGRKVYFVDGAVRNAALQRGIAPLKNPEEMGALLENLAAASLRALCLHSGLRLHHWRDGKNEVDLILEIPNEPLAFEIGSSPEHTRRGLRALIDKHPRFSERSYIVAPNATVIHPESTSSGIGTLPIDTFLLAVGAHSHLALARSVGA